ncbi:phospholipase B1, membrane-associated-like [Watersipora subatra]|uniref:phospholipase B1, membrane-associated-like n=1 Tax=Watersipora subatra TaxID=2589382 RepID=UPI00355C9787
MHVIVHVGLVLIACSASVNSLSDSSSTFDELRALIQSAEVNETIKAEFKEHFKAWDALDTSPNLSKFTCQPVSDSVERATSVHRLRPEDIDVVAAIGDSITAGCGSNALAAPGILREWRGLSWSIGGDKSIDEGVFTIPNMLKKFNPKVKGFSTGTIPVFSQGIFTKKAGLNMAVSGAKAGNILTQAKNLVKKMSEGNPVPVDIHNDWKLVTLFIGGNDLCAYCKDEDAYSHATYQHHLNETLNYLRDNLPRTLVNVVPMLDLTQLSEMNGELVCGLLHRLFCKCGSYPTSDVARQVLVQEAVEYSESIIDLIDKENSFDRGDDFTVVAQPFLVNQRLPSTASGKPDLSYFAPDCFHFSVRGHATSAQALWNNMFEPAGRKRLSWYRDEGWNCPTSSNPYIFTYGNSDSFSSNHAAHEKNMMKQTANRHSPRQNFGSGLQRVEQTSLPDRDESHAGSQSVAPMVVGIIAGVVVLAVLLAMLTANIKKKKREISDTENSALL